MRATPLAALAFVAGLLAATAAIADWNQWRGPNRDGISEEKDWKVWGPEGPKKAWEAAIGAGYSAVSVAEGRAFTMGNADGQDTVWCFDAETGKVVWKHSYPCGSDREYPGPRATPAVDGDTVYTLSRKGNLFALDAKTGKVRWSKDATKDPGSKLPKWDYAGSPLIAGDLLLLNLAEKGIALDKRSGKVVWKSSASTPGYASPVLFEGDGRKSVLFFCAKGLCARDLKTGEELWWWPWETSYDVNSADPIVSGNRIFISSDYDHGCGLLEVEKGKPRLVWENSEMRNHTNASVLYEGHLYGADGKVKQGDLKCMDLATGAVKWSQRKLPGSPIIAGGKLVYLGAKGDLLVLEASPQGYREQARASILGGDCWTVPVLANGRFYCRNTEGTLVCLDVR